MVYALYGRGTLSAKGAKMAPSYIICSLAPTPIYDGETGTVPPRILVVHPRPGLPAPLVQLGRLFDHFEVDLLIFQTNAHLHPPPGHAMHANNITTHVTMHPLLLQFCF